MNEDKPIGSETLVKLIRMRIGQEFDHECHLMDAEARAVISSLQSLQRQLEEAREALRPFASVGHGLIPRKAGGWHRLNDFGRKEVILDITFSDLEPFRLAASTLGRVENVDNSSVSQIASALHGAPPGSEPSGRDAPEAALHLLDADDERLALLAKHDPDIFRDVARWALRS